MSKADGSSWWLAVWNAWSREVGEDAQGLVKFYDSASELRESMAVPYPDVVHETLMSLVEPDRTPVSVWSDRPFPFLDRSLRQGDVVELLGTGAYGVIVSNDATNKTGCVLVVGCTSAQEPDLVTGTEVLIHDEPLLIGDVGLFFGMLAQRRFVRKTPIRAPKTIVHKLVDRVKYFYA